MDQSQCSTCTRNIVSFIPHSLNAAAYITHNAAHFRHSTELSEQSVRGFTIFWTRRLIKNSRGRCGRLVHANTFCRFDMCSRFCLSLIVKRPQEMNTELLRRANKQVILKTRNKSEEEFCLHRTYGPLRIHINLIKSKHSSESNTHCGLRQRYTRPAPSLFSLSTPRSSYFPPARFLLYLHLPRSLPSASPLHLTLSVITLCFTASLMCFICSFSSTFIFTHTHVTETICVCV